MLILIGLLTQLKDNCDWLSDAIVQMPYTGDGKTSAE